MKLFPFFTSSFLLLLAQEVAGKSPAPFGVASRPQALIQEETIPAVANIAKHSKSEKEYVLSQALSSKGGFLGQHKNALAGALAMAILERGINKVFVANSIKFPAQLAGCIGLFVLLVLADIVSPGLGESFYSKLLPGSALLAKWFPVLFVPGLVALPLAPSIGNGAEVRRASWRISYSQPELSYCSFAGFVSCIVSHRMLFPCFRLPSLSVLPSSDSFIPCRQLHSLCCFCEPLKELW